MAGVISSWGIYILATFFFGFILGSFVNDSKQKYYYSPHRNCRHLHSTLQNKLKQTVILLVEFSSSNSKKDYQSNHPNLYLWTYRFVKKRYLLGLIREELTKIDMIRIPFFSLLKNNKQLRVLNKHQQTYEKLAIKINPSNPSKNLNRNDFQSSFFVQVYQLLLRLHYSSHPKESILSFSTISPRICSRPVHQVFARF